jgi:hypothetical protein
MNIIVPACVALLACTMNAEALGCVSGESPSECHDQVKKHPKKKVHSPHVELTKQQAADLEAAEAANSDAEIARLKRPDPKIGMTMNEVTLGSNWGSPDRVNTTITSSATTEQWVYSGEPRWRYFTRARGYLYFRDGVLSAIQK